MDRMFVGRISWKITNNPSFVISRLCVPFTITNATLLNNVLATAIPTVAIDNILQTPMDAVCGGYDETYCGLLSESKQIVCWNVRNETSKNAVAAGVCSVFLTFLRYKQR